MTDKQKKDREYYQGLFYDKKISIHQLNHALMKIDEREKKGELRKSFKQEKKERYLRLKDAIRQAHKDIKELKEFENMIFWGKRRVISDEVAQFVYERNIKKFGTLTCYLCGEPVSFGEDAIDHIFPVIRGGCNDSDNLEIVHKSCNSKKGKKLLENYVASK